MTKNTTCSAKVLSVWDEIQGFRFTPATQAKLLRLKKENHVDYCTVLGLIFGVAVYKNDELPDSVQAADAEAFSVTILAENIDSFPGEVHESRDPAALWVQAAEMWDLEGRYIAELSKLESRFPLH